MKLFFTFIIDMLIHVKGEAWEYKISFLKSFLHLLTITIIGAITAPIIWPFYYFRRFKIFNKLKVPIEDYNTNIPLHRSKVYLNWFDYILFLYGDKADPLCKELPEFYELKHKGKPKFIKWFLFSAIRNPMFNYHYKYMRTKHAVMWDSKLYVIIDNRTHKVVRSDGIGDSQEGKYLIWREDNNGAPYFYYQNTSKKYLFYCGYCGLDSLYNYQIFYPRLEISIRKIKNEVN